MADSEKSHSRYSSALQHLFEYIDELNRPSETPPSLESLLAYTHSLSNRLSSTLNNMIRAIDGCDSKSYEFMRVAIDEATESITTTRGLMVELHRLRNLSTLVK